MDWLCCNAAVPNNTGSNNPEVVSLNISSVAGNQSTVTLRLVGLQDVIIGCSDMKIVEAPPR